MKKKVKQPPRKSIHLNCRPVYIFDQLPVDRSARRNEHTFYEAVEKSGINPNEIAAVGITNQRETTVVWDKETGDPIYNAIVWLDKRTKEICEDLKNRGLSNYTKEHTGLVIDSYFSATNSAKGIWMTTLLVSASKNCWTEVYWCSFLGISQGCSIYYQEALRLALRVLRFVMVGTVSFVLLVFFGWVNIYSTTLTENHVSIFDFSTRYGKQLFFIGIAFIFIIVILSIENSFYERFASLFYVITILLLMGLFVFGKTKGGATSWYSLGFSDFQPSELGKLTTSLALAKFLSDIQTDIKKPKYQLYAFLVILIPILLILPQPDPGSALVYFSLFFVLFREGFPLQYLGFGLLFILLFVTTLMFGVIWVGIGLGILTSLFFLFK